MLHLRRLQGVGADQAIEHGHTGNHHVIAAAAGQQFGLEHVGAVEGVIVDADAGLLLEAREGLRGDVIGPAVDVDGALNRSLGGARPARDQAQCHDREKQFGNG